MLEFHRSLLVVRLVLLIPSTRSLLSVIGTCIPVIWRLLVLYGCVTYAFAFLGKWVSSMNEAYINIISDGTFLRTCSVVSTNRLKFFFVLF